MLGGALLLIGAVSAILVACGGQGFQGHDGGGDAGASAGSMASAGEGPGVASGGALGDAGAGPIPGMAGADSGSAGEGGAGPVVTPPSIVVVQTSRTSIVGNADPSLTLQTAPSAGNALIVGISCFSDLDNCVIPEGGVTDNQGNSYALVIEGASIVSSDTHGTRPYLFIAHDIQAPAGPLTITVNPNGMAPENVQNFAWGVLEVSGLAATDSVDQTGSFPNTCCFLNTTVSTDAATTQPNELAVAVHTARSNDNDFNYGHDPAWMQQHVNDDGVSQASQLSLVTRVLTETGVVSHTWTHDEPSRGVSAVIATFRGVAR